MDFTETRNLLLAVAYLAACAVKGVVPEEERISQINLKKLFIVAKSHLLTGITAMALESVGIQNSAFEEEEMKAIRKNLLFNAEKTEILSALDENGIWYLPLKGCVLEEDYPKIGMRQMSDIDILFDASRALDVKEIFEKRGYQTGKHFLRGVHDVYSRPPIFNFEMHRALFSESFDEKIVNYYRNVKTRLVKDDDNSFGYHFRDEDFYVYFLAHAFKHYEGGGTGLRTLLDIYVFWNSRSNAFNFEYLAEQLKKTGLIDFEEKLRSLALHLFEGEVLTKAENDALDYIFSSGVYGTIENQVLNSVQRENAGRFSKLRYIWNRIFLPISDVKDRYPWFLRIPILLPFLPLLRIIKGLLLYKEQLQVEMKTLSDNTQRTNKK